MQRLLHKRVLLVTGKGGVGKTTLSAAFAKYAHQKGKRVLVVDMDKEELAPSMLFEFLSGKKQETPLQPTEIQPNLVYARMSPKTGHEQFIEDTLKFRLFSEMAKNSKYLQRFLMAAPAFQDMGSVYVLQRLLRKKRKDGSWEHELVIVDLPATGHALAITSMPNIALQVFQNGPIADSVREAQEIFYDQEKTGALIVSLAEPLPVSETLELIAGLQKDNVPIAGLCLNRVPPLLLDEEESNQLVDFFQKENPAILGEWSSQRLQSYYSSKKTLLEHLAKQTESIPLFVSFEKIEESETDILSEKLIEDIQEL